MWGEHYGTVSVKNGRVTQGIKETANVKEKQLPKQIEESVKRSSIELTITFMEVLKEQYGWNKDQLDELAHRVSSQAQKRMAEMRRYNGTGGK